MVGKWRLTGLRKFLHRKKLEDIKTDKHLNLLVAKDLGENTARIRAAGRSNCRCLRSGRRLGVVAWEDESTAKYAFRRGRFCSRRLVKLGVRGTGRIFF